jgi:low temperature requirement protein LtrA
VAVPSKRVSWVELYFDLVFVLAVAQVAHAVAAEPTRRGVGIAAGLFFVLWWTWVGFATQYNRLGAEGSVLHRLLILAGTVPCGAAAVAVHGAATGHPVPFTVALAAARVVLALAHTSAPLVLRGYAFSAVLFGLSTVVPSPWRYVLWVFAIGAESGVLLRADRKAIRQAHRDPLALPPADPAEAVNPHHYAERFGLFVIIVLGELVVSAGQGVLAGHNPGVAAWLGLAAGIALAGALWWLYFDSAADLNERLLELSGGSPIMARSIFATGHLPPTFALILVAAGLNLLLGEHPPDAAYWLVAVGVAVYLTSSRVVFTIFHRSAAVNVPLGLVMVGATVQLAWLGHPVGSGWFLAIAAAWTTGWAALATVRGRASLANRLTPAEAPGISGQG